MFSLILDLVTLSFGEKILSLPSICSIYNPWPHQELCSYPPPSFGPVWNSRVLAGGTGVFKVVGVIFFPTQPPGILITEWHAICLALFNACCWRCRSSSHFILFFLSYTFSSDAAEEYTVDLELFSCLSPSGSSL